MFGLGSPTRSPSNPVPQTRLGLFNRLYLHVVVILYRTTFGILNFVAHMDFCSAQRDLACQPSPLNLMFDVPRLLTGLAQDFNRCGQGCTYLLTAV